MGISDGNLEEKYLNQKKYETFQTENKFISSIRGLNTEI